jgi:transposase-like protein
MSKSILDADYFHNAEAARKHLETQVWPNGPVCPHCGVEGDHYKLEGKSTRPGLYKCSDCREPFTVTVGTVFERSKIPLNKWLLAVYLLCSSKKGMSSHQLHRTLGVTYKTAWFMTHRIREAFGPMGFDMLGGGGSIVEADETYWGTSKEAIAKQKKRGKKLMGGHHKMKIFALVERGGNVRTFQVKDVNAMTLKDKLTRHVDKNTRLMTDEALFYKQTGKRFASHEAVNHSEYEYSRGDVTTNSVEGYFSILKRGLIGTYHHVGEQHLQRYVNEFDFRYNNRKVTDSERADNALKGIIGKRLTYRRIDQAQV